MLSVAKDGELSLYDRWILDTGSSTHVCNNRELFVDFTSENMEVTTGDSTTKVLGRDKVRLIGRHPEKGRMEVPLSDALYSPSFHTNLVSYAMLKKKGGTWCQRTNCIRDRIQMIGLSSMFIYGINSISGSLTSQEKLHHRSKHMLYRHHKGYQ